MKRRTFLAAVLGAPAVVLLPAIAISAPKVPVAETMIKGTILEAGPIHEVFTPTFASFDWPNDPYTYHRSYVIGIGRGDARIVRIWRDGVLVFNTEGDCAKMECAHFGLYDATSGHGVMRMKVEDGDVTDTRGAIPEYRFEVRRS